MSDEGPHDVASGVARANDGEFFVGYLASPPGTRRFLWRFAAVLAVAGLVTGGLFAAAQRDPGGGVWEAGTTRNIEGVIVDQPYPALRAIEPKSGSIRTFLLVTEGKFGAGRRLAGWNHKEVRLTGHLLDRDGRSLLELTSEPEAIRTVKLADAAARKLSAASVVQLGHVTLRGEIIDPKCYIGAMKPGGGKTHKACAQLCLSGGIPPMFVTRDTGGTETYYLLTDSNGSPAQSLVLPFVGDPVQVSGTLERIDDLLVLRIVPSGIDRL